MGCGSSNGKKPTGKPDMFEVVDQDLLMDSNEVKILRIRPEDPRAKGISPFDGYV